MVSGVFRPQPPFSVIGRFLVFWSLLPGGQFGVHLVLSVISSTSLTSFVRWVHSWLQVSGSVSSYLFPLLAGGGGEPSGPFFCMPCSSTAFSGTSSGACPTLSRLGSGICVFCFLLYIVLTYLFFILYRCPCTVGLQVSVV